MTIDAHKTMVDSDMDHKRDRGNRSKRSNDASGLQQQASTSITTSTTDSNKRSKNTGSVSTETDEELDHTDSKVMLLLLADYNDEKVCQTTPNAESESILPSQPYEPQPPSPPKYGSKSYWDDRYQQQFLLLAKTLKTPKEPELQRQQQDNITSSSSNINKDHDVAPNIECSDVTTLPYHSWYFTYDELRITTYTITIIVG